MVLLTIAVVAGVSAVVAGLVTGGLEEPASPIPPRALPTGPLTGQDVANLRFVQAFRGYRMDQVDAAMDSLAAEVERLRALLPEGDTRADVWSEQKTDPRAPGEAEVLAATDLDVVEGPEPVGTENSNGLPAGWPAGRD
jgi:DivIVA domain-containing protein